MTTTSTSQICSFTTAEMDADLLFRIKTYDDQQAFNQLFQTYYPWLCQHAKAYCQCTQRAEEIVLDVFTKFWNKRAAINVESQIKAYLFIAVRNQALDYLRRQKRRRNQHEALPDQTISDYASPEELCLSEEFSLAIEAAIQGLPPQGQTIFRLSREVNLKYREIADQLGISIKTVETHMRRAFIQLRKELQPWLAVAN